MASKVEKHWEMVGLHQKFGGEGNGEVRAWSNEKCREKRI